MGDSKHELDIINMYYLKGICQITPLPSQNAHLSTTATFFFTGGHFECSCVQPLYKEGVIAVIKMAREIQIVLFMFISHCKFHYTRKSCCRKVRSVWKDYYWRGRTACFWL